MNKYSTKIILFAALMVAMTACQKEKLTTPPQTSVVSDNAFSTSQRITNQVLSLYASMKSGLFLGGRAQVAQDIRGEEFLSQSTNLVTGRDVWSLNVANNTTFIRVVWSQAYLTINRANVFIDGMNEKAIALVGQSTANNYIAEARFIRAVSYYYLLQLYAKPFADANGSKPGLPLRIKGITLSGDYDLARSTVAQVYDQIIQDLDFAEANLPATYATSSLQVTRAHKNTAIAFKTRVYLSMQRYTDVIREANKIIPLIPPFKATSGVPHELQSDIVSVFTSPYTTSESILSMPMSNVTGDIPGGQNQMGFYWLNASGSNGTGEFSLNPTGIIGDPSFASTDRRRAFIFNHSSGRQYLTKFPTGGNYTDWVPVIRWAEVMLNLSEALARQNGLDARSLALLNAVRQRSSSGVVLAPATAGDLINAILKERRMEFLGEGLRNIDLMRLLQTIPAKADAPSKSLNEQQYIWLIPAEELALNNLMTDN